jgi:hypothetical protein
VPFQPRLSRSNNEVRVTYLVYYQLQRLASFVRERKASLQHVMIASNFAKLGSEGAWLLQFEYGTEKGYQLEMSESQKGVLNPRRALDSGGSEAISRLTALRLLSILRLQ